MATLSELQAYRDKLEKARFNGTKTIEYGNNRLVYRDQAELDRAIHDLDRQIAALDGTTTVQRVVVRDCKGAL